MKIAQIAPLIESVPPKMYGGTERVVSYLTEELVRLGHEVTLFASGDSKTKAHLKAICPNALRLDPNCMDTVAHHIYMLELLNKEASDYDIIHSHVDYLAFSHIRRMNVPCLTTLHGRLDLPELAPLYHEFTDIPLVSISMSQRTPLPWINWAGNVYHGIPDNLFSFHKEEGKYLAFLGRICPDKRLDLAIEIAKIVGMPLKIAAKVDPVDQLYFESKIKPLINHPLIEYLGEIGDTGKNDFLGKAYALLFPIDWPEPFGMVMIESWACGTPVISRPYGSAPELIKSGVNGYMFEDIAEGIHAVENVSKIDRRQCRATFEENFSVRPMAQAYLQIYESLIGQSHRVGPILEVTS